MCMGYIKVLAKNKKENERLLYNLLESFLSKDIGMKSGTEKYVMLIMKKEKSEITKERAVQSEPFKEKKRKEKKTTNTWKYQIDIVFDMWERL